MSAEQHVDPVVYVVTISHWQDGDVDVSISGVGSSESDRAAVAHALREAARKVEDGEPVGVERFA